jgi:hypothetical protein
MALMQSQYLMMARLALKLLNKLGLSTPFATA